MKKIIFLVLMSVLTSPLYPEVLLSSPRNITNRISGIQDGWYEATVNYANYATGTNATYSLNVRVEYGSVTKISFGNGGSVHNGYNSEGYVYTGGYLTYEKDYYGNIVAATTTVNITDNYGMRVFNIRI